MIDISGELGKYGLSEEAYELCLKDIKGKISGQNDLDWLEIIDKYKLNIHSDTLRKASQNIFGGAFVAEYMNTKEAKINGSEAYLESLRSEKQEIRKEKQKLQDERNELSRLLREEARKESFAELIKRVMSEEVEALDYRPSPKIDSGNDMIICLSDIHAGIKTSNFINDYNMNTVVLRLKKYLDEIISIQAIHKCKESFVILGGDMISGFIHPNLRLQNNENVVDQVKKVSIFIGHFIKEIATHFEHVKIFSVSGNHSRLTPQKESHLRGEELDSLIPFYLELMFKNNNNVFFPANMIDDTIVSFKTRGKHLFYAVHGDKDTPKSVAKNLSLMTGQKPDAIIMSHRHHTAYETEHNVKIIQTGSLVGVDDFCVDNRISGRAEQTVIITNSKDAVRCFYDVNLQ